MNILFVCKWNRFRSKAAEGIFNKVNDNSEVTAKSGGLFPDVPVSEDIITAGEAIRVTISKDQNGLPHELLMWSDYIIVVADDVPVVIFDDLVNNDGKKVLHWKIRDIQGSNVDQRKETMVEIDRHIVSLLRDCDNL